jgi:hypothetical protein
MRKLSAVALVLALSVSPAWAQFTGSGHDFSDGVTHYVPSSGTYDTGESTWNVGGEDKCTVCHNAHTPGVGQPLWFHKLSTTATYLVYDATQSQTLDATVGQPTGTTILCLSCHDGVVGVDQYGWGAIYAPPNNTYTVPHPINGDLSHTHPISFDYNGGLAAADGFLYDPATINLDLVAFNGFHVQGTLDNVLLDNGQMQCATCHDVHNKFALPHALNIPKSQDQICETCHNKG